MVFRIPAIIRFRYFGLACAVVFGLTALIACGGGSGGSNNTAPTAIIANPFDGAGFTYGDTITFTGSGTDAEDGDLNGLSLVWRSDLDGEVGTGTSLALSGLSWGDHTITLTATDSDGTTASDAIAISVKAWIHPTGLSDNISPDGQIAGVPQVVMDGNGNSVISWAQNSGANSQIYISEYRNGAWIHPSDLSDNISPDGQDVYTPQIAVSGNGDAIITWSQFDGGNFQVFMSEYRHGVWSHPADLTDNISPDGQDAGNSHVAMDDNGNTVIVWLQSNGSRSQVFKSEYRNGVWTHPADLTDNISPNAHYAYGAQVGMDGSGNAIIAWYGYDGSDNQVFISEYRTGVWSHPSDLTDNISPDGGDATNPHVAMDSNGDAMIVWEQFSGITNQIFKSEYRNGVWSHPADLTHNISPGGQDAENPHVAMDDNGNAVIAWMQMDGSNYQIFKSEYRNGVWRHPGNLSDNISPDGQDAEDAQVSLGDNGDAVITWHQSDGGNHQVFISEYRNGVWSHPADLTDNISPDGPSAEGPKVAMDINGDAIVTWRQSDGSQFQIFMSEYY